MSQGSTRHNGSSPSLRVVARPIDEESLRNEMLHALPSVRIFAKSLCGAAEHAEDIVQEAVANALANMHAFQPGTNMAAWLMTITRNAFLNGCRKRARDLAYRKHVFCTAPRSIRPEQDSRVHHSQLATLLLRLPPEQREALLLVGGSGLSQEEAAKACGVAIGTIKSRVHRARLRLAEMMQLENGDLNDAANEPFAAVA